MNLNALVLLSALPLGGSRHKVRRLGVIMGLPSRIAEAIFFVSLPMSQDLPFELATENQEKYRRTQ